MARRNRTTGDIQTRFSSEEKQTRQRRPADWRQGLDQRELVSAVCQYFCKGHPMAEIRERVRTDYGVELKREDPWQIVSYAAAQGWLHFAAPYDLHLREQLRRAHPWLQGVEVVHTATVDDVAARGAEMLLDLVRRHHRPPYARREVHIGMAGGHAMQRVAREFAALLHRPTEGLPEVVVLHSIVAAFNVQEPTSDPNAFFTYFTNDPAMVIRTRFVGLHAPAIVRTDQIAGLRDLQGIEQAYSGVEDLDIIVTSASCWTDEHSMLLTYMKKSPQSFERLKKAGCVGDLMWRPLSDAGPLLIERGKDIRAMTLLELTDLPRHLHERGKHVLLVLGPCSKCRRSKGAILRTILHLETPLLSHLVVDTRTAREVFHGQPEVESGRGV